MLTEDDPSAARTLDRAGLPYRLYRHPAARNEAELHLTGLDVATSAKTLAFSLPSQVLVLAAIPGLGRLKYGNLAKVLGVPRSALRPAASVELLRLGMLPGGVSPVCTEPGVQLVVDAAVLQLEVFYCGSGSPESSIEISPASLLQLCPNLLVAVLSD